MSKSVIITGVTGQIGSGFARFLLNEGHEVHGIIRRTSSFNTSRIDDVFSHPKLKLHYGDMTDGSVSNLICDLKPDYFINQAAMSHVAVSFDNPEYCFDVNATGVIRCLEAIRRHSKHTRVLQASTSELYGDHVAPQNELTPFKPRSPYAVSKLAALASVVNYREAYNIFAANSITFNTEGPARGATFLTRKVTLAAARISLGLQKELRLGNLCSKRSWTHYEDQLDGQWLVLNADEPDDYCIGLEESHSIQEFVEIVFSKLNLDWKEFVICDPRYFRPTEVDHLEPDCTKIRSKLGWKPKHTFQQLVDEMVKHDLDLARKEKILLDNK